ncbi:mRNA turnover protein 4 mrt4, putative [Entamoeba invadens IP1]|uniref:Ribosome assembly factor mrt4 n=1 Tax=Entamoeba invadens IP1 TaxID=370355 RepID=A0A0A1UF24_ENTIV|nr:mRNA turnover protein 4 mrt4, putative [Entamoeba invadens IP1]ELP95211.1 mRNA turnover protein 4 mrt4, putative [Entamoeba invadens IP1]|eukprot:XP_004261982.1 mRNA turnover protein 4 mrt4, putative [Entamoeba invadens IP1]
MSRLQQKRKQPKREVKDKLISNIQEAAQNYPNLFLFYSPVMRNNFMKEIRHDRVDDSIFFFGSNKVMQVALGRTADDEVKVGAHLIAEILKGQCGLCFTKLSKDELMKYFKTQKKEDFAKSGFTALSDFVVPEGPLQFPGSMEVELRTQHLPVELKDGVLYNKDEYVVCKKGTQLTTQSAQLLKHFGVKMAQFEIHIVAFLENGNFEKIEEMPQNAVMQMEEDD